MNEPVAEYPIDGSRMDRITWIYVRAWPQETERGGASLIPDNHVRAVGEASASPGWRDGPLLRGLRDKVADAFGASDPVLQDTQLPLLVGDLYARLLVEEADAGRTVTPHSRARPRAQLSWDRAGLWKPPGSRRGRVARRRTRGT